MPFDDDPWDIRLTWSPFFGVSSCVLLTQLDRKKSCVSLLLPLFKKTHTQVFFNAMCKLYREIIRQQTEYPHSLIIVEAEELRYLPDKADKCPVKISPCFLW